MKTKILLLLLCLLSLNVMGQGTIQRKKKQPTETVTPKPKPAPKPAPKQTVKMCDICEKPLSKCDYGGKHPYCNTCGKLKERCEYNGNHPVQQTQTSTPSTQTTTSKSTTGTINGHEWVDLGLSVKWATCNVGADSPSDYGGYYAWGETSTKSSYDWDNCFDCVNPKKRHIDPGWGTYKLGGQTKITPTSGHDTARENWGGTWRMPTDAENEELCNKCTWAWTTQGGHKGYKVTGPNGNSIFLPAAGWRDGSDTYKVGESGIYWSSSLSSSVSGSARYLHFDSGYHSTGDDLRSCGQSVRPVTE